MADGDDSGYWWAKFNIFLLLEIFLSAKIVSAGNWSCVARVVLPDSDLPAKEGNLEGGGLWLEDVRYLVPAGPNGVKATWVQHTQLIAMPCILTTYFKTKSTQANFKDGIGVLDIQTGEKLQPLKWSAGIQAKKSTNSVDKLEAESIAQAVDALLFPAAGPVTAFNSLSGGVQVRIRARFQAANYQFIYRFDLGDDGKIAFGIELTGATLPNQPFSVHLHQILAVLVPGKGFANASLLQVNTGKGDNQFATIDAATAIMAKQPFAGWSWHEDGVLALLAAPGGAKAPSWPEKDTPGLSPLGTGVWWWLDPPTFHPLAAKYAGDGLPDLIALDFAAWYELANEFPQKDTMQIARVAWDVATKDNVDPKSGWQGLASNFYYKIKPMQTPMLISVVRHLHFPMLPESTQMAPHFVSQTVRLRGSPS